jgi:hypothetical protein
MMRAAKSRPEGEIARGGRLTRLDPETDSANAQDDQPKSLENI